MCVFLERNFSVPKLTRSRGRFAEYDLNNEMIHDNYYEKRLGPEITKRMAEWVRQGDPDVVLYLNDHDILTGNQLEKYVAHIKDLLGQDVPLGGIGVQCTVPAFYGTHRITVGGTKKTVRLKSSEKVARIWFCGAVE